MDLHNKKRMLIANGLEKRGDPGPQPPAANMMELVINTIKSNKNSCYGFLDSKKIFKKDG